MLLRINRSWAAVFLMLALLACGEPEASELPDGSRPEASTQKPAGAARDDVADVETPSEPAADPPSEAPSSAPSDPPADVSTDSPSDPAVDQPTDSPSDPAVDQPTDPPNDPAVDPPTDPANDPPVDLPVDPPTELPVDPPVGPEEPPTTGNGDASCSVPAEAREEDVSRPDSVIGDGSPQSCTSDAFVDAVARGGVITFDCGPDPVVITLDRTAKVFNDQKLDVVIDGGGRVTLSGGGRVRILYQNACDPDQVWTTSQCDDQDHPRLTVQNLSFIDGNAKAEEEGGGAIFVRGGRFKAINSQFFNNLCQDTGPDVGGGAIRVFDQHQDRPVYIVNSRFGGEGLGNVCSNGGALSSIGVSYTVINSTFTHNQAIGFGANPQRAGTPGGGSGGAIYNDGNTFTLTVCGSYIANNSANEGGGAIFFVSNDRSGSLVIEDSALEGNPSDGFETEGYPGIFVLANGEPRVSNSTLEP